MDTVIEKSPLFGKYEGKASPKEDFKLGRESQIGGGVDKAAQRFGRVIVPAMGNRAGRIVRVMSVGFSEAFKTRWRTRVLV